MLVHTKVKIMKELVVNFSDYLDQSNKHWVYWNRWERYSWIYLLLHVEDIVIVLVNEQDDDMTASCPTCTWDICTSARARAKTPPPGPIRSCGWGRYSRPSRSRTRNLIFGNWLRDLQIDLDIWKSTSSFGNRRWDLNIDFKFGNSCRGLKITVKISLWALWIAVGIWKSTSRFENHRQKLKIAVQG